LLAAAAFPSAFFSDFVGVAFFSQLPFSPDILPATGLKPGQQWFASVAVFFAARFLAGAFFVDFAGVFFAVVIHP